MVVDRVAIDLRKNVDICLLPSWTEAEPTNTGSGSSVWWMYESTSCGAGDVPELFKVDVRGFRLEISAVMQLVGRFFL